MQASTRHVPIGTAATVAGSLRQQQTRSQLESANLDRSRRRARHGEAAGRKRLLGATEGHDGPQQKQPRLRTSHTRIRREDAAPTTTAMVQAKRTGAMLASSRCVMSASDRALPLIGSMHAKRRRRKQGERTQRSKPEFRNEGVRTCSDRARRTRRIAGRAVGRAGSAAPASARSRRDHDHGNNDAVNVVNGRQEHSR